MADEGCVGNHLRGRAEGWLATATFAKGGSRAPEGAKGERLVVHALNPERGTGSSVRARFNLLKRAVALAEAKRNTVFLTSAGFFGCVAPPGNSSKNLSWSEIDRPAEKRLLKRLGDLSASLPAGVWLSIGFDRSGQNHKDQELWWFCGGQSERMHVHVRAVTPVADRVVAVGSFKLMGFVCGGIFGHHGIQPRIPKDLVDVDVVLDAAHASMNRRHDREDTAAALRPRWAFHRTIRQLGDRCGAVFAQARGADENLVRNCDNWIVYRGERPFPDPVAGRRVS